MEELNRDLSRRLEEIRRLCLDAKDPVILREQVFDRILAAVPADEAAFVVKDPVTCLAVDSFGIQESDSIGYTYFSDFYLQRELITYLDMRASKRTFVSMSEYTGGRLGKDPMYCEFFRPRGYKHHARLCFATGRYYWGALCIGRGADAPDFSPAETTFLQQLSEPVGEAMRLTSAWRAANQPTDVGQSWPESAVVLLDDADRVLFRTEGVQRILADLVGEEAASSSKMSRFGLPLPVPLHATMAYLRSSLKKAYAGVAASPSISLKGCSGEWWTVTATLPEAGSAPEVSAVLILAKARPQDTAAVVLASFGLTPREEEIVRWVRLGFSTNEMASRMSLSPYTVQDHLKRIFAKVEVASRGELMAKVFREESPLGRAIAAHEG